MHVHCSASLEQQKLNIGMLCMQELFFFGGGGGGGIVVLANGILCFVEKWNPLHLWDDCILVCQKLSNVYIVKRKTVSSYIPLREKRKYHFT